MTAVCIAKKGFFDAFEKILAMHGPDSLFIDVLFAFLFFSVSMIYTSLNEKKKTHLTLIIVISVTKDRTVN